MSNPRLRAMQQSDRYASPWSRKHRVLTLLWLIVQSGLFRLSPKPLVGWRLLLLRIFGCRISGRPFVDSSALIKFPWQLFLEDRSCIGPGAEIYNLGRVTLRRGATIAQYAYLCGGTHNFESDLLELVVGDIEIGEDAFVGAKALVLPGVVIGKRAIVGAAAVVTRDVEPDTVVAGNPARMIKKRGTAESARSQS